MSKKEETERPKLPTAPDLDDEVEIWTEVLPTALRDRLTATFSSEELVTVSRTIEVLNQPVPAYIIAEQFENVVPGAAALILKDVLESGRDGREHDRQMDRIFTEYEFRGQYYARFALTALQIFGLLCAFGLGWKSIESDSNIGMILSGAMALGSLGGPLVVKFIVEKMAERYPSNKDKE